MPREKDPFRKYVTFLNENNSKWRCNFCGQENGGGATRIKAHLAGIGGFGIRGCERVDDNVRADAKVALMAKRGMDSSDRGVSGERMQGNVRGALPSTSHPPILEGGTNLQLPQGEPPSTQSREWMGEMLREERADDIANGATSYFSAFPPPNSFFPESPHELLPFLTGSLTLNSQQNPSAPLPSQNRQLLDNISQNESLGTQLPNMATTSTPQHSNQPHQSFHMQCGHGTGLSPPRDSMDIEPPIIEPFNSPWQIPEDIINTTSPSMSEGMPKGAPAGASSFQYDRLLGAGNSLDCNRPSTSTVTNAVPHSNQPVPSCNEESGTETSSFPLQDSGGICPVTALQPTRGTHVEATAHVNLQVLEGGANTAGPSPSQVQPASVPPQHQSVPHHSINHETRNAQQNPAAPSSSWNNHSVRCLPAALMDMDTYLLSSSQVPNKATPPPQIPPCGTGRLIGPSSLPELHVSKRAPMTSLLNTGGNFKENGALKRKFNRLYSREYGIRNELEYAASLLLKKPRMEVLTWLKEVDKLRIDFPCTEAASEDCLPPHQQVDILMREAEDLMRHGNFPNGLFEARETKISKLLEEKMVGEAFQRNTVKILEYLVENQISRLGIYGMGGVGKTTLMVHIHNRLLEIANYGNVLWITVSQDFNTQRLQDDIWKALGSDIPEEKDARKRAAMLSACLTRGKSTIILDDVWEHIDLEEVGIPVRADGFKLVLTTRSFDVCCQMQCQEKIKIEPLSQKEAESLFMEELGSEVALNLESVAVMKCIVKECAGLPLGVITMAASMRGATDVFEWRDSLVTLKESSMGQTDMEKKVLMNLKFSYDRLGNSDIQQCFLSCALYPEDELIDKFELVEFFIDQGLIDGLNTRKKQYDRGLTILNKLENVCLLEAQESKMKMHDLIRDMALHIMSATSIVKAGKRLRRISPEYWTDALEKVSLMRNPYLEFPLKMSPNCPKLSTILFNNSMNNSSIFVFDSFIPHSFFKHLRELKVLNLSGCCLHKLPDSISNLVNLRALLLRRSTALRRIPYLGKLTSLRKLDASKCFNLEALEGLGMLVNLRYLDLIDTCIERLPKGTLGGLLNLQYLKVRGLVSGEDITKLGALETLECYFEDADDFNKYVRVIEQRNPRYDYLRVLVDESISRFKVKVSDDALFGYPKKSVNILAWSHAIVSVGGESSGICILIPQDVQTLEMSDCNGTTNLSDMGRLEYLESLNIRRCENLRVLCGGQDEEVINIPAPTPAHLFFPRLTKLEISGCPKLKYLFGHGFEFSLPHLREIAISFCKEMMGIIAAVTSPPPHPLPALEVISVGFCDKMKRVVESEWLPHFPNLREIEVSGCENMEEIIGGPPPNAPVEEISLESLYVFHCDNMRKLIPHEWLLHLRGLQIIRVECCEGMVEMISGAGQGQEGSITTPPVNNIPSSFQSSISLPKLTQLSLHYLPELKSICEVPITCDSMESIKVCTCPKLSSIPLQLRFRDNERPFIHVEGEEKWKTLMWDHPNAQAILQPYLQKVENFIERLVHYYVPRCQCSPNAIELSAEALLLEDACVQTQLKLPYE